MGAVERKAVRKWTREERRRASCCEGMHTPHLGAVYALHNWAHETERKAGRHYAHGPMSHACAALTLAP